MPDLVRIAAALRELADAITAENIPGGGGAAGDGAGRRPIRNMRSDGQGMLSAAQLGTRFDRSASWAKAEIRAGRFPGAFRLPNQEWRVPEAAVTAYIEAQKKPADVLPLRPRRTGSISDWRKLKRG